MNDDSGSQWLKLLHLDFPSTMEFAAAKLTARAVAGAAALDAQAVARAAALVAPGLVSHADKCSLDGFDLTIALKRQNKMGQVLVQCR